MNSQEGTTVVSLLSVSLWAWSLNVLGTEPVEPGGMGVASGRCLRVNLGYCAPGEIDEVAAK